MELIDYLVIGYLIVLFLVTAYFRRSSDDKLKNDLSYSFLYTACLSTLGFFAFYYLVENRYYYIYIICSLVILIIFSLISFLKNRYEKKDNI